MDKTIKIDWKAMGAKLASSSDKDQGEFFEGFAFEIDSFDTEFDKMMQMTYVQNFIKEKYQKILKKYVPQLWYKEGEDE